MNSKNKNLKVRCPRDGCKGYAIIDPILNILPCQKCQDEDNELPTIIKPEFYSASKINRIQEQRDTHGIDTLQPYLPGKDMKPNPDFVKHYPDMAKEYFSEDQLKKM